MRRLSSAVLNNVGAAGLRFTSWRTSPAACGGARPGRSTPHRRRPPPGVAPSPRASKPRPVARTRAAGQPRARTTCDLLRARCRRRRVHPDLLAICLAEDSRMSGIAPEGASALSCWFGRPVRTPLCATSACRAKTAWRPSPAAGNLPAHGHRGPLQHRCWARGSAARRYRRARHSDGRDRLPTGSLGADRLRPGVPQRCRLHGARRGRRHGPGPRVRLGRRHARGAGRPQWSAAGTCAGRSAPDPVPTLDPSARRAAARRPASGNFRLLADGRLAVVDFGSTLPMPRGWPPRLAALLRAGRDQDASALFEVATHIGLISKADVTPEDLLDLLDPLLEPLRGGSFNFSRSWLRSQTMRFSDPRSSGARTQRKLRIPVRHLLIQRVAAGTTGVLCLLGATVPVADEAAAWMPQLDSPS